MTKKAKASKKVVEAKQPAVDPAQTRAINAINNRAAMQREQCIRSVAWVEQVRSWAQSDLAIIFDELRKIDAPGSGVLTPTQVIQGFKTCKIPVRQEELETLSMSMDILGDQHINYCCMPKVLRCYGGGLMETIQKGLERVMTAHRQQLSEIDNRHAAELRAMKQQAGLLEEGENGGDENDGGDDGDDGALDEEDAEDDGEGDDDEGDDNEEDGGEDDA